MIVQEPVQAAIWHALNNYAYSDAIFHAERLYAEVNTDDALYLLATCYYRSGKTSSAYEILRNNGCRTSQCNFLLARCCLDLKKYPEAELALSGCSLAKSKSTDEMAKEYGDSAAFAIQMLGEACSRTERFPKAADAYKKCLRLNPFLWSAYESLVDMGEKPDPNKIFTVANVENFSLCQGSNPFINLVNRSSIININSSEQESSQAKASRPSSINSPVAFLKSSATTVQPSGIEVWTPDHNNWAPLNSKAAKTKAPNRVGRILFQGSSCISPASPSFGVLPLVDSPAYRPNVTGNYITPSPPALIDAHTNDPCAPTKKITGLRRGQNANPPKFQIFSQTSNNSSNTAVMASPPTGLGNVRRSSRLFSSSNSVKENNKVSSKTNRFVSSKATSKKSKSRTVKNSKESELNEANKQEVPETKGTLVVSVSETALSMQKSSAEGLMKLLQDLGWARLHLGQYNCQKAIEVLNALPVHHLHTGWVLTALGRAYFELAEYEQAVRAFQEARRMEPHRLEGMEYYSTALWHLQQEVALSALAQELIETNKEAPETWCVAGNCFSLQKEHETAIKFLQRAVQVNPEFAYAYTLLGHEHVITEEMERAMACFRNAIRIDPRHYNAWYGVGMIYYKQEKYPLAEVHFKRALAIHPQSSVLMCHIGVVQHDLKKTDTSLATLNRGIAMDPKNPLCKFHRARIYFSLDRHQEALKDLEELKEIVPKESRVFFLIGKVHKKLGNTHLALMNFSWAMDLDPKGANNHIKEAIDKRYSNDEEDAMTAPNEPASDDCVGSSVSHSSSIMDAGEVQVQAMESDESF